MPITPKPPKTPGKARKKRWVPPEAERQAEFNRMRAEAVLRFPAAFAPDGEPRRPLALGVYAAIRADGALAWPARRTGWFLSEWTVRPKYLAALAAEGSRRINLDGSDAGEVSEEHRARALKALSARTSRRAQRARAALRQAREAVVTAPAGDASDPACAAGGQRDRAHGEAPAGGLVVEGAAPAG